MKRSPIISIVLVSFLLSGQAVWAENDTPTKEDAAAKPGTKTPPAPSKSDSGEFVTEKRSDGTTVKYKKKTSYDFEGASIDGLYNKPSGSYISNIKDVKGKSIIRVRENFDAEVIDSSRLIK
jgi:hypothetical protein